MPHLKVMMMMMIIRYLLKLVVLLGARPVHRVQVKYVTFINQNHTLHQPLYHRYVCLKIKLVFCIKLLHRENKPMLLPSLLSVVWMRPKAYPCPLLFKLMLQGPHHFIGICTRVRFVIRLSSDVNFRFCVCFFLFKVDSYGLAHYKEPALSAVAPQTFCG